MIIAQYNPIRFYSDKRSRQFENTENKARLVTYPMYLDGETLKCKVPQFSVIIGSLPDDESPTVDIEVYDCMGVEVYSSSTVTVINKGLYSQIIFNGDTIDNDDIGIYEIKLIINENEYWSDVFMWDSELDNKLKITAESSAIRLGMYEYEMINTVHEFYLNLKKLTATMYLKEDANESKAITSTIYGSSALVRAYNLIANEPIFIFLSGLRILSSNGSVVFTHRYIDYEASDIVTEVESDIVDGDMINVKIEFKVLSEVVSVINV